MSPVEVDCEEVLRGDAGPPRQRRVVLDARGRDERRGCVEEGRVRARAHQFAAKVKRIVSIGKLLRHIRLFREPDRLFSPFPPRWLWHL